MSMSRESFEFADLSKALSDVDEAVNQKPDLAKVKGRKLTAQQQDEVLDELAEVGDYRQPWERREGEGPVRYEHFKAYLELGPARSYAKAAKVRGVAAGTLEAAGALHDWVSRAQAYDRYMERLYQTERQLSIRKMAERHGEQIVQALDALTIPAKVLAKRFEEDPEAVLASLEDMETPELIDFSTKTSRVLPSLMAAERLSRGAPTEIIEGEVVHKHEHNISRAGVAEVIDVLARAGAFNDGRPVLGTEEVIDIDPGFEVHPEESSDIRAEP